MRRFFVIGVLAVMLGFVMLATLQAQQEVLPVITSFSPTSGPPGTNVQVNFNAFRSIPLGTAGNFIGTTPLNITGHTATPAGNVIPAGFQFFTVVTIPANATSGRFSITVRKWIGNTDTVVVSATPFTVTTANAPTISSFTPKHGPVGTVITITGTNLSTATRVVHGGKSIPFTVNANGTISATIPSDAFSTGLIGVTTPTGSAETGNDIFAVFGITSITPTSGPAGTQFIINGSGFSNQINNMTFPNLPTVNGVRIGGVAATFTVLSFSQIRVTAGQQSGTISLQTPINTLATTATFTVTNTVQPTIPTILNISPRNGPPGTVVTITGTGFTGVTSANFQGQRIPVTVAANGSTATFTVPANASPVQSGFSLNLPSGGIVVSPIQFTVTSPPSAILSFSPTSGRPRSIVTVLTTPYLLVRSATIGGVPAEVTRYGASSFFADIRVPLNAVSGLISLVIARPTTGQDTTIISTLPFTVLPLPPAITSVSPVAGFAGTPITLTGEGFTGASAVTIGGAPVQFSVNNDASITATAGASSGLVQVTTPVGTTTSNVSFSVLIPAATITNFTPTSGGAGTVVTITGTNLTGATNVSFGAFPATNVSVSPNGTSITATVGAGGGSGAISLQTPAGFISSSTNFFFLPPPPSIASVSPITARVGEVSTFTIQGTNLLGIVSATLGQQATTVGTNTATQVVVSCTPLSTGFFPISINTASASANSMNINVLPPLPVVTGISPTMARAGTVVTIIGSNFSGATAVSLGGTPAQILSNNGTSITASVGNGATGQVSVTTPAGTGTGAAFTFDASLPPPVITSLSPISGNVGTQVTITGTNLPTGAVQVLLGESAGHTVVSASPTMIVFVVGNSASIGAASVQAFNASVQANSAPITFTVTAPPALAAPTLASPANSTVFSSQTGVDASVSVTLQWNAVSGANQYEAQTASTSDFANPLISSISQTSSGRTISRPNAGSPASVRFWRVRARNTNTGAVSPWSGTWTFFVPSLPTITAVAPSVATQGTTVLVAIQGAGANFTQATGVQLRQGAATISGTIAPNAAANAMNATFMIPATAPLGFYDVVVQNAPITLTRTQAISIISASEALPDETVESGFKVRVHGWGVSNSDGGVNMLNPADYANINYLSAQYPQAIRDKAAQGGLANDIFASFDEFIFGFSRYGTNGPLGVVSVGGVVQTPYVDRWVNDVDGNFFRKIANYDGVCAGYARVALLNYAGESVYQFAKLPFEYKTPLTTEKSIQRLILSHWAYQESGRTKQDSYDILGEVAHLRSTFKAGNKSGHPILSIKNAGGGGGHQVVPFRITATKINGAIIDSIYVYDPNHPGDETKAILVNRNEKTWRYPPLINAKYNFSGANGLGFRWVAAPTGLRKFSIKPSNTLVQNDEPQEIRVSFTGEFTDGSGRKRFPVIRTVNAANQAIANSGEESITPSIPGASVETIESGAPPNFSSSVVGFTMPDVSGSEILTTSYRAASTAQTNRYSVSGQGSFMSASWLLPNIADAQILRTNTQQTSLLITSPQVVSSLGITLYGEERSAEGASTGRFNTVSLVNTELGVNDSLTVQFAENLTRPVIEGGSGARTYTLRLQQGAASREVRGIGMQPYERHQILVGSWANLSSTSLFLLVSGRNTPTRIVPLTATGTVSVRDARSFSKTLLISPNPASQSATLQFVAMSAGGEVEITVRTVLGQEITRFAQQIPQSGVQTVTLETSNYAQGAYIVSVKEGGVAVQSSSLVIVR
jgi:hypothetical protein